MWGTCTKIRYRLETVGMCCNSVDLLRQVIERQAYWYRPAPIPIPTNTGKYRPIPDTSIGLTITPMLTGVKNVNREHRYHFRQPCSRPVNTGRENVYWALVCSAMQGQQHSER